MLTCESRAFLGKRCLPKSPIERVANGGKQKRGFLSWQMACLHGVWRALDMDGYTHYEHNKVVCNQMC